VKLAVLAIGLAAMGALASLCALAPATVAHDARWPLTAIGATCGLIVHLLNHRDHR
jgi:hypothetical protein